MQLLPCPLLRGRVMPETAHSLRSHARARGGSRARTRGLRMGPVSVPRVVSKIVRSDDLARRPLREHPAKSENL